MGRMKHGKPNPHNDRTKVVPKKNEKDAKKTNDDEDGGGEKPDRRDKKYTPEEYRKRLLESNHDRYDEPPETYSDDDDEADEVDETKSLDYIKNHYSGISSHFQFEDEKEWHSKDEVHIDKEEDVLQLDLLQLSKEIHDINIFDKLNLSDVAERVGYCVDSLADIASTEKSSKESHQQTKTHIQTERKQFVWSYKGLEQLNLDHKTPLGMCIDTPSASSNSCGLKPSPAKLDHQSVETQDSTVQHEDELDMILGDVTPAPSVTAVSEESQICEETKSREKTLKHEVEKIVTTSHEKGNEDLDLDELLSDSPSAQLLQDKKGDVDGDVKHIQSQETGAKELDDWLDSILD